MQDPIFGAINYDNGFWRGHVMLTKLNYESELVVKAGEDGPTDDQRDWFQLIDENMNFLVEEIKKEGVRHGRPMPDFRVETVRILGKYQNDKQRCSIDGRDSNLRRVANGEFVGLGMKSFSVNDLH